MSMDSYESHVQSFIIKFWLEKNTEGAARTAWSGQIKHVPSGDHRYIKSFEEMVDFIRPYLKLNGVGDEAGFWKWFKRRRLRW
jgi:hypothetical protein